MNNNIFHKLSYGVYIISTMDGNRPTGCTANSVMQVTASPATIAVSINHENYTNGCMEKHGTFSISVLSENSNPASIGTFGFQSGKDIDKFASVDYLMKQELPVLADACGYLICRIIDRMESATHTVFLAEVVDGELLNDAPPMTYAYYHQVIKGSSPKNAPTYLPEEDPVLSADPVSEKTKAAVYVCSVCGYIYEGDVPFEELPESYVCPLCRAPKSKFVRREA